MAPWGIKSCTVDDAEAVARNTCGAFWEEPMWKLQWTSEITQDFLTRQLLKRQPIRLLRDRDALRHQKAVDPETGELVGYTRWRLPDCRVTVPSGGPEWAEAQMPDVSAEERSALEATSAEAWWDPRTDVDALDEDITAVRQRVTAGRPHLELELLGVHPRNKGRGIATLLIEQGIRLAKQMQLPILAISYRASRGVYARLGFIEAGRITKDDTPYGGNGDYSWYFMIYDVPKEG